MPSTDRHQALMDQAYERFKKQPNLSHADFLQMLQPAEHFAVVLGNFNYQVENGGFSQWLGNRYATKASVPALRQYLRQIGTPAALATLALVDEFWLTVNEDPETYLFAQTRRAEFEVEDEDDEETFNDLDKAYYAVNAQLMVDAEAFIARTYK